MKLGHELKKADIIMALGTLDTRVAEHAAHLYLQGYAPYLVCTGSGTVHSELPIWRDHIGSTEAEVFADVALRAGVPRDCTIIENKSQNTGQNYEFTLELLAEKGITPHTIIAVQKPYMERRTYATGKIWLPPSVELIVTSPPLTMAEYPDEIVGQDEHWIHNMVGDLQRIKEYPARGYQITQDIPDEVWSAYEFLVNEGYTKCLIRD